MAEAAEGGCTCGRVRYRLTAEPIIVNACHCRLCQRTTGSAFALNAMIEDAFIDLTGEEPEVARSCSELSDNLRIWRCRDCGTQLWGDHPMMTDNIRYVFIGTLDRGEAFAPAAHFFVRSKHPWIALPPDIPSYDTLPEDGGTGPTLSPENEARMAAAFKG